MDIPTRVKYGINDPNIVPIYATHISPSELSTPVYATNTPNIPIYETIYVFYGVSIGDPSPEECSPGQWVASSTVISQSNEPDPEVARLQLILDAVLALCEAEADWEVIERFVKAAKKE